MFIQEEGGPLKVWVPPSPKSTYVIGADVAEGLEHGDYSCAQVIDVHSGDVVACWHGHRPPDVFAEELILLGRWYNTALLGIESNNHGLTTVTAVRQASYPNVYRERQVNHQTRKVVMRYGWATNRVSKPLMIDNLDQALRDGSIKVYDQHTLAELRTYVRDERGRMHGSPHDDRVMALAIAVQMIPYATEFYEEQDMGPARWTGDWWFEQILKAEGSKNEVLPIGFHHTREVV